MNANTQQRIIALLAACVALAATPLLVDVYLPDGRMLNHELVRSGLAWWYAQYAPKDDALQQLAEEARTAKLGLWADARPIPPWGEVAVTTRAYVLAGGPSGQYLLKDKTIPGD